MKTRIPWTRILKEYETNENTHYGFICHRSPTFKALWHSETQATIRARAHRWANKIGNPGWVSDDMDILFIHISEQTRLDFLRAQVKQKKPTTTQPC